MSFVKKLLYKSCFVVPTTQMSIFILFVSAGILFEVNFFLWVSLKKELSWKTFGNGVTGVFLWSEGYSNSSHISKVDRFANIVGGFQPLTDFLINYLRCFSRFWIHLWWDLQNFSEQLLCRTFVDGCFYHLLTEENSTFIVTDDRPVFADPHKSQIS